MKLELYSIDLSPYGQKVKLLLEMKQLAFSTIEPEREWVRQGGYGDINPIRKIPTLVVDGIPLPEAEVICEFIEDQFPDNSLRPSDALKRAKMRLLSRVADLYIMSPLIDLMNNLGEHHKADVENNARSKFARGLDWLEHYLSEGPYALGDERSVADAAIPPILYFVTSVFPCLGLDRLPEPGPKTKQYFKVVSRDPDVERCLNRMETARAARFGQ